MVKKTERLIHDTMTPTGLGPVSATDAVKPYTVNRQLVLMYMYVLVQWLYTIVFKTSLTIFQSKYFANIY